MKKLFLLLFVLSQCVYAQVFDFSTKGEESANNIVKSFINTEFDIDDVETVAYNYDSKIIGIVKHNVFYSLGGYKLIVLKKDENGYTPVKCDIFFDNTKELNIDDNKITYYKSIFYKNKKYHACIKNNEIKTNTSLNDTLTDKKVQKIEYLTRHTKNENVNIIELADLKTSVERNVNIKYNNLNEKTKHYIEMR